MRSYLSTSQLLYVKGYEKVEKEMSDYEIMEALKKFKAALSYLINDDDKLRKVQKIFIS